MRYLFLPILICLPALFSAAQDVPQGPSPLVNSEPESPVTNNALQVKIAAGQDIPAGYSPPSIIASEDRINVEAAAANGSVETNSAALSQASFLMDAGVQYEDAGEYAEAEQAYLRALQNAQGNADILFRLSTLYIQMKRYADAVKILDALAVKFPDNAMVHNNLAWVYATGGEMRNGTLALRHAREALLSAPFAPSIWNTLAEAYYVSGKYEDSLRSSDHAMELLKTQQKPSDADLASFGAQRAKIQRAAEAYKMMQESAGKK